MTFRELAALTLVVGAAALIGCDKSKDATPAPQTASNGKAIYEANGCARCHGASDSASGGGRAPNLSKEGATHDAAWIAEHIKNPKTHSPASNMPAYAGKISDPELGMLAGYLAGLK